MLITLSIRFARKLQLSISFLLLFLPLVLLDFRVQFCQLFSIILLLLSKLGVLVHFVVEVVDRLLLLRLFHALYFSSLDILDSHLLARGVLVKLKL